MIKRLARSQTARQTSLLYASLILGIIFGTAIGSINTRALGPKDYGSMAFYTSLTLFIAAFFDFGFSSAGGVIMARAKTVEEERELIGALTLIGLVLGAGFSLVCFSLSLFIDQIFQTQINDIIRITVPVLFVLPFQCLVSEICRGSNAIGKLALFNLLPRILYVLSALVLLYFDQISLLSLILVGLISWCITIFIILASCRPTTKFLSSTFASIWQKNKEFGLHFYFGNSAEAATLKINGLLIPYFVNPTALGYYNLSELMASPMVMFSKSLSQSLFKGFAQKSNIPSKVIRINFLWSLLCTIGLVSLSKYIVSILFSDKFLPLVPLILPMAAACFFQSLYQPYNHFLIARGIRKLGTLGIYKSIVSLVANIVLIPQYGAMGAAIATLATRGVEYLLHYLLYCSVISAEQGGTNCPARKPE